jgi:hypothetical protein
MNRDRMTRGRPSHAVSRGRVATRDGSSSLASRICAPHPCLRQTHDHHRNKREQNKDGQGCGELGRDHAVVAAQSFHSVTFKADVTMWDTAPCTAGLRTTL